MKHVIIALMLATRLMGPQLHDLHDQQEGPRIEILGADEEMREITRWAANRFASVGLELPRLTIHLHQDESGCNGKLGLYGRGGDRNRIDLCMSLERIVLHELAHAWERHHLTDRHRAELLEAWNLDHWQGKDVDYLERGVEIAANIVASGLGSKPLTPAETRIRRVALERFEQITNIVSPRVDPTVAASPLDRSHEWFASCGTASRTARNVSAGRWKDLVARPLWFRVDDLL